MRALVAGVVLTLGVDQHLLAGRARAPDHARDVRETALAIVREYHCVARGKRHREIGELGRQHLARGRGLEVHAQELLPATDDAQLLGGADRAVLVQARTHAVLSQHGRQEDAFVVVPDDGQEMRPDLERRAVARDVRGAARARLFLLEQHDRHRRLG